MQKTESRSSIPQTKLEARITEAMRRRAKDGSSMKSFDNVILKFPKVDESLRKCKATFQEFGKRPIIFLLILSHQYIYI